MTHPSTVGADACQAAYKESVVTAAGDQARHLLDSIGARHTAAALGLSEARTVRGWARGDTVPRGRAVARRLTVLFRIVRCVEDTYSPAVAAVFLRSANPQLDDRAPLVVLAGDDVDAAEQAVLAAARAFIEG